jgi:hypothetical protein
MKPLPQDKTCFLCGALYLAEWARTHEITSWHISEICPRCEGRLRDRAA